MGSYGQAACGRNSYLDVIRAGLGLALPPQLSEILFAKGK